MRFLNPNIQHSLISGFRIPIPNIYLLLLFSKQRAHRFWEVCVAVLRTESIIKNILKYIDTFIVQLEEHMYYRATEGSDIFWGFQRAKTEEKINWLSYVHWFSLYSEERNPFMPTFGLFTLFTVSSTKGKCGNWPLFKNITLSFFH